MDIFETIRTAISALKTNKVRTLLTMLGIIIGVFSVILLIALVKGVQNYVTDQFNSIGSNLVFVSPGRGGFGRDPATTFTDNKLAERHVQLITDNTGNNVMEISPLIALGKTLTYKTKQYFSTISATYSNYDKLFNIELASGRFFDKGEERSGRKVVVIGDAVRKELFSNRNPIGESIKIEGHSFEVIGVAKAKSPDFDQQITIPYKAATDIFNADQITYIIIKLKSDANIDMGTKQIELAMLRDLKKDDFSIMTQKDILNSIQLILGILQIGLGAVAAISLLVGGIGIMNIMLVAVSERIMEIGLRKAVGATPLNIATQFVLESIFLSIGGGLIGLGLGTGAALAARVFLRTEIPWWSVLVSLGFSVFVGVLFGTYPAIQASKKDPIESLRFE